LEIKHKVIVVTGGARGIGLAVANRFLLEKPKKIILVDIKFNELKFDDKKLICKECDVTNEDSINALIDEVNREYGLIDIFCSNAGVLSLGMNRYPLMIGTKTGTYM